MVGPEPVGGAERNAPAKRSLGWSETTLTTDPSARGLNRRVVDHTSDQFRVLSLQAAPGDVWLTRVTQYVDSATSVQTEYSVGEVGVALPVGAGRVTVDCRCGAIGSATRGARLSAMISFGAPLEYQLPQLVFGTNVASQITYPAFATSVDVTAPDGSIVTLNPGLSTFTAQPGQPVKLATLQGGTLAMTTNLAFCLVSFVWTIRR